MEKIKFRSSHFYHKDNSFSHFSYWGRIDHKGNFDNRCFSSPSSSNNSYIKNEEQFTGLKDKNGKEIYEGDILKDLSNSENPFYIIEWDNETCSYNNIPKDSSNYPSTYKFEVIGSIHENPELLNV